MPYEATLVARANRWLYSCYKTDPHVWLEWVRVKRLTLQGRTFFEDHLSDILAWCPPLGKYVDAIKVANFSEAFEFSRDGALVACQDNTRCLIVKTNEWQVIANLGSRKYHPVFRFSDSASLLAYLSFYEYKCNHSRHRSRALQD